MKFGAQKYKKKVCVVKKLLNKQNHFFSIKLYDPNDFLFKWYFSD